MDFQQPPPGGTASSQALDADARKRDVEENKDLAAFSYVWIMSVFVYISKRQSPFVAFHAKQGMVLFLFSILFWFIPGIWRFLELIVLGGAILGFLAAAQGQWKEVPIIGSLARGTLRFSGTGKVVEWLSSQLHALAIYVGRVLQRHPQGTNPPGLVPKDSVAPPKPSQAPLVGKSSIMEDAPKPPQPPQPSPPPLFPSTPSSS